MKYLLLIAIICFLSSCNPSIEQEIKVNQIPLNERGDNEIEKKIKRLSIKVKNIEEKRILKSLTKSEKVEFLNRLEELKMSLNKTILKIKEHYGPGEERELRASYNSTHEIWDYVVEKYKI